MASFEGVSPDLLYQKSEECFKEGLIDKAEAYLMYIVRQTPFFSKSSMAFYLLGMIYHRKNKFQQALKFFRKALEVNPSNTDARVSLSLLLCDLGLYKDAEEIYNGLYEI